MARKSRIDTDESVTGGGNIYDFGLDTEAPGEVEDASEDLALDEEVSPVPIAATEEPEVIAAGEVSAQTNAEIEAGRAALAKFAANAAKE